MSIVKKCLLMIVSSGLMLSSCFSKNITSKRNIDDTNIISNINGLAKRVLKTKSDNFIFELINEKTPEDFFELSTRDGHILIKGNNGVSMASGLNWYLKKYCNAQFTIIDDQLSLPDKLPLPETAERIKTDYKFRYFFNICTFSYTMAWWNWEQWERQIDWMAMNGINLPLAIIGQEAVWYEVYKELGLTDNQLDKFLVGPAYLPWSWMGNIDSLGGPLPKSWMESHKLLQQKILERERAFGMTPVLQGFTGHVPEAITSMFPNAKLHKTGDWSAGFGGTYFLDPGDDLFKQIGKLYIEKQTEMYGTDHFYSADCFNEVNPDTNDTIFLASMGRSVYNSIADVDPEAVWVMQAWFLYYNINDFWKEPQIRALLGAVPNDRMIILDLYGELHPTWKIKSAFYGKPWIWNVLSNFGGRTSMNGKLIDMTRNLQEARKSTGKGNLSGIGMAMEYFGNNPVVEEFVMDMVWNQGMIDIENWISDYSTNRYGKRNEFAQKAWNGMLRTVYNSHKQTGTFLCERPGFYSKEMTYRTSPVPDYDVDTLNMALENLLKASNELKTVDTYQFDVVNLTRQCLSPLAYYWILDLQDAYNKKDIDKFHKLKEKYLTLISDFDCLLSTRKEYLLGIWIEEAKSWGESDEEKSLYEFNARNLITLWGEKCTENQYDDLNNYAYKQWAGMFSDYHLVRWKSFFDEIETALINNKAWTRDSFLESSCLWEKSWSHNKNIFQSTPSGDPVEISGTIWEKYKPFLKKKEN